VMPNNATDRRAGHRMMTRHVTHNAPYHGAFDTAVSATKELLAPFQISRP